MKNIFFGLFLLAFCFTVSAQSSENVYLYYGAENDEKCIIKNEDGSSSEMDSFFKLENKSSITFFVCGERFYLKRNQNKLEIHPISEIEDLRVLDIHELKQEWKASGLGKHEAFSNIYLIQKVSPDQVVYHKVKWL
ncbi:hypothetical protein [Namhaeicola litoreus]|uniref:Uncharacterized protein n=1 Tax=Namhaeicola litoreus TaxID=1052145 RepID=A0ABW3Y169_9FLAO